MHSGHSEPEHRAGRNDNGKGPFREGSSSLLDIAGAFMDRHRLAVCALLIFLMSAVGHMRALRNNYVLDDYKLIVCNDFIADQNNARILLDPRYLLNPYPLMCGARPLTVLSLLIDYKLWRHSPFGYHLTNILIHALNSAAVLFLTLLLLRPRNTHGRAYRDPLGHIAASVFSSLVFAFHPIQAEVVNIASFRADLLATCMYLLSLITLIKAVRKDRPGNVYYVLSFMFFVFGLFSKETVITLAGVLLLYVVVFVRHEVQKRTIVAILSAVVAAAVFILLFWRKRFYYLLYISIFPNIKDNVSPLSSVGAYFNTLFQSFLHYGRTLLFPAGLSIDYEITITDKLFNPGAFLAILLIGVLAGSLIFFKNRLFRFGAGFWLICYLPVSNLFPLINTVNDRYMYLPMVGFSIALAAFIFGNFNKKIYARVTSGTVIAALIVSFYAALSVKRNLVFENSFTLYSDAVKIAPTNVRVRYNLAVANMAAKEYSEAIKNFGMVSSINPLYMKPDMLHLLGLAYHNLGELEEARRYYRWALTLSPKKETYNSYAAILKEEGNTEGAAYLYAKSIELGPNLAALNNLGIHYAVKKQYRKAADYFKAAIGMNPGYTNAWANLVKIANDSRDQALSDEVAAMLKRSFLDEGRQSIGR